MKNQLKNESPIYDIITKLRLIDTEVGGKEETIDFDAKHLGKRLRNNFIGSNFTIGSKTTIFRKDVLSILKLSPVTPKHSLEQLINPKDKQNVSLATDFLSTFSQVLKSESLLDVSIRVSTVAEEIKHLVPIIDGTHMFN